MSTHVVLKDFTIGKMAYLVCMHIGRNQDAEVKPVMVLSVGRKYVQVDCLLESHFMKNPNAHVWDGLVEKTYSGEGRYLFPTESMAKEYIERDVLLSKLCKVCTLDAAFSLVQLQKVFQILGIQK